MSKPQNPLSKFRSYNYYHVLAICKSTEVAEALSTSTSLDVWQHSVSTISDQFGLDGLGVKSIDTGEYCILINGSTDASFSITRASVISVTNGSAAKNDNNTSIAIEGSIDISEPRGVLFLDRVVSCCVQMGIDSSSAIWCLKTFFVGYTDTDTVEYITDVKPILFLALDVTGSFTEQGGLYNINFVSISHGSARLPPYSKSGAAVNFKVGADLTATFANLTDVVQKNYDKYYKCAYDTVGPGSIQDSLRSVKYKVEAVPPYDSAEYKVEDQLPQAKSSGNPCNGPATTRIDANSSIESGIHSIMAMCEKAKSEKSREDSNHLMYDYKIHSTLESKDDGKGGLDYTAIYRVKRHEVHTSVSIFDVIAGNSPNTSAENTSILQQNIIEFDYLYTGHNLDILEFDMKLSAGLAYLNIATAVNSYNTALGDQPNVIHTVSNRSLKNQSIRQGSQIRNIPVTFGNIIKNPVNRNSKDGNTTTQSAYTMSKHASLEVSEVSVKIIGNPRLLSNISKNTTPSQVQKNTIDKSEQPDDIMAGWGSIPSIAKINIKMPRHNDDSTLFTGSSPGSNSTGDYAVDFWFNGYYYIMQIEHIFDGGEFTQVLNLLGIPDENALASINTHSSNVAIGSCYDNQIGCKKSQNKPPLAIPEKLPLMDKGVVGEFFNPNKSPTGISVLDNSIGDLDHTNRSIAGILTGQGNLNDVAGYAKATTPVKDAIDAAAIKMKLTPSEKFTLTNLIATESNFNPNADNPNSTALGLGQFLKGTWPAFRESPSSNILNPYDNALATAKYMKHNQSVLRDKLGREPTREEIYLGHKEGTGGATSILTHPTPEGNQKKSIAYHDINKTLLGNKVPYVPHSIMFNNTDLPDIVEAEKKKNKDAIAANKDCDVEEKLKSEPGKTDCTTKPPTI
jgi:SLT domain-containing protein